jgi:hypothetical protein
MGECRISSGNGWGVGIAMLKSIKNGMRLISFGMRKNSIVQVLF